MLYTCSENTLISTLQLWFSQLLYVYIPTNTALNVHETVNGLVGWQLTYCNRLRYHWKSHSVLTRTFPDIFKMSTNFSLPQSWRLVRYYRAWRDQGSVGELATQTAAFLQSNVKPVEVVYVSMPTLASEWRALTKYQWTRSKPLRAQVMEYVNWFDLFNKDFWHLSFSLKCMHKNYLFDSHRSNLSREHGLQHVHWMWGDLWK